VKDKKDILNQAVERLTKTKVSSGPPQEVADATVARLTEMSGSSEQPNMWRIIMNSKITKFAAAAVIIIGVFIGINQFGGSIDGASVAWGQVVEQLNNYTKYKCRQRVVREKGPEVLAMDVYHLNLSLRRQEVENGDIHIIDMRGTDAITVELKPAEMKATVTKLLGFGPRKDPHIIEMVKRFEQESTERLGTKEVDGKILQGFRHTPDGHNDYTVWVDPETKLPVEIELVHTQRGQTIFLDEFEFDFELDPSAFSTDIPDGYEVETLINDYRPVEAKDVTAEDIRSKLNHTAYTVEKLPWMEKIITIETIDPLGTRTKVYMTGIYSNDGNAMIIVQGDYYDIKRMVWIPNQQLVLETPGGIELYTHPNDAIYAKYFLESFAKAKPEFFDIKNLSEERFTWMIVMPDQTILSLSANKQMSDEKVQELVESLTEIKEQEYAIQSPDGPQEFIPHSCIKTVYRRGELSLQKKVYHKTLSLRREEDFDHSSIKIFDLSTKPARILILDPENRKALLKIHYDMGPAKNPDMLAMLAARRKDDSQKLGIHEIDGISAEGFRRVNAYNDITIWANMETGLPVKMEIVHLKRNQTLVFTDFDFETELDESLFLTVSPEGYDLQTITTPEK
jgi:outer membrane lipoprotein-sorting protein